MVVVLEGVFVEVVKVREAPATHRAHVGLVVFMHHHVAFDVARLREASEADGARVWLDVAVSQHVRV